MVLQTPAGLKISGIFTGIHLIHLDEIFYQERNQKSSNGHSMNPINRPVDVVFGALRLTPRNQVSTAI